MATITTDTFLDGGTAVTAGEIWTCNGGRLTVRTDTRWHAKAPASMTGALGSVFISATLGGGFTLDGTKVRWMPFGSGSGTVPAIGATITQGGVSGYLLGVWASITAAPTAVGAAMPATGFLKFREVTGGPFAAGALTGISASATSPDVVGWIEVVMNQATNFVVPRLGDFTTRGDWFALGTTSGASNQLVQAPTNGSATTYLPGVWIETAVADEYEFYPALAAALMATANLGTDERSKFVCMETTGAIRIGHNGTAAVGYVPPAGRKIRTPNIFGRQCLTTTRAVNAIPQATATTRPKSGTTSAGAIDVENFANDWYWDLSQSYSVRMVNSSYFDSMNLTECATAFTLQNVGNGCSAGLDYPAILMGTNASGGLLEDCVFHRFEAGPGDHSTWISLCAGITMRRVKSGIVRYARSTGYPFNIVQSSNIIMEDCTQFNGPTWIATSTNVTVRNLDHVDRYVGATITTTGVYVVAVSAYANNVLVDGVTFGLKGLIANCHPYLGVFNSASSSDITFRNAGSRNAFLSGGSANSPNVVFDSGGANKRVRVQRCYVKPTRSYALTTVNSDKGNTYDHVYGDWADLQALAGLNEQARCCGGTTNVTAQASVYGTHFWDMFLSDTVGRITLPMNEPTVETAPYVTVVAGTPKFTSAGQLTMQAVGDEVIFEQHYYTLGVTGLSNTAPVINGTNVTYVSGPDWGNHDIWFQYDIGAGWSGTWLDLTAANLSGVGAINPAIGVKLKYRVVCDTAATTNALTYIRVQTDSTLAAQTDNLYPLDVNTVTFTGLPVGCDMVVLSAGTSTVLYQVDSYGASSIPFTYSGAQTVDVGFIKPGYVPQYIRNLSLAAADSSLPISLTVDRTYA